IPDSLFIKLLNKSSAMEYYDALKAQFEQCSLIVGVELRQQLGELKLKEGGDAHTHIEKIMETTIPTSTFDYATLIYPNTNPNTITKLYDSGASQHMSPFCEWFINFKDTASKPIHAADNRTFSAISKGDLYI
ncbi:hypothetical protein PISMIDRAFT_33339, partial [Pisolithus microcarpus 441]